MSQTSSPAAALSHEADGRPTLVEVDDRLETWPAPTHVRVVCKDSVIQFVAASRGQARHLLDESIEILTELDARRARTSHLHPSWPR